jgi:thioesterase domain-containing protein
VLDRPADRTAAAGRSPSRPLPAPITDDLRRLSGDPLAAALETLVRDEVAAELGHGDPATVDVRGAFTDQGLDSVSSIQLRTRLVAATGVAMSGTVVFDHPTPAALAAWIAGELAAGRGGRPEVRQPARPAAAPAPTSGPPDTLAAFFHAICSTGDYCLAVNLLISASAAPIGGRDSEMPAPVPLTTDEDDGPVLICLPSFGPAAAAEFLALSRATGGTVVVLPLPGFATLPSLPETRDELFDRLAGAAVTAAGDRPLVLVGRSSGGLLAHAVADRLERRGRPASGLVLLDTYESDIGDITDDWMAGLVATGVGRLRGRLGPDAERTALLATGGYLRLLRGWRPGPLVTPSLLVAAGAPVAGMPDGWRTRRSGPHQRVEVPGDHFSMLDEHAGAVATAIRNWIGVSSRP